jgi:hypothetical protein
VWWSRRELFDGRSRRVGIRRERKEESSARSGDAERCSTGSVSDLGFHSGRNWEAQVAYAPRTAPHSSIRKSTEARRFGSLRGRRIAAPRIVFDPSLSLSGLVTFPLACGTIPPTL